MPIQGTAADIMKRAMIDVHAALEQYPDARTILTVHDELLFEVPEGAGGRSRGSRARDDAAARVAESPADGRCGNRGELEGREKLGRLVNGPHRALNGLLHCSAMSPLVSGGRAPMHPRARSGYDALSHQLVEIVRAARPRASTRQRRAHPRRPAPHPRPPAGRPGRAPQPPPSTARCCSPGFAASSMRHSIAHALIDRLPFDFRTGPCAPDRARSPTSPAHAHGLIGQLSRARRSAPTRTPPPRPRRPSKYSVSPRPTMNSIRSRGENFSGLMRAKPLAGVRQIFGRRALAESLEVRAGGNQIRAVGRLGDFPRLVGGVDRGLELTLVVRAPGPVERIARIGGNRRCPSTRSTTSATATRYIPAMVALVRLATSAGIVRQTLALLCAHCERLAFVQCRPMVEPRVIPREEHTLSRARC